MTNFKPTALAFALAAGVVSPQLASAQECQLAEANPEIISRIPSSPSYFTKVHASGDFAFYISSGNNILHLEDSDPDTRSVRIPGWIDPVPSHDGKLVTIPGLEVYLVDDVLAHRRGRRAPVQGQPPTGGSTSRSPRSTPRATSAPTA